MKNYIFLLGIFINTNILPAQDSILPRVIAISRSYDSKIVLRLLPTNMNSFRIANERGYIIQRAESSSKNYNQLNYIPIRDSVSNRLTEEQAINFIEKNNKYTKFDREMAGLAFGLTEFGKTDKAEDILINGAESLNKKIQNESMMLFMIHISCNRSQLASKIMGLWVEDENVSLGKSYVYRIKISDEIEDWHYINVTCQEFNPNYLLNKGALKVEELDTRINFTISESNDFYSINVDRSNFDKKSFIRLNKEPFVKINPNDTLTNTDYIYCDTNLLNYKTYHYKVWGSTPFGDELLLSEFEARPRDKTAPSAPFLKSANHIKPNQVELLWEMKETKLGDLKGFNIKRCESIDGKYNIISYNMLPPLTRRYIDESFIKEGSNYYLIEAIDTAGNMSRSFPLFVALIDSTPPKKPEIVSAVIDSLGKITIITKPNIEKDFMGYELQKANSKEHEFSIVYQTFRDSLGFKIFELHDSTTLNTLTKKIYYKIIAFDQNFNQSTPSELIELTRRDTIAPVPAIINDFEVNDTSIILYFSNSSSEDVVNNILLRKEIGQANYDTIFTNKNSDITYFLDANILSGKQYEYTMFSTDLSRLNSLNSRSLIINSKVDNKLPVPTLAGQYNKDSNQVTLIFGIDEKLNKNEILVEINERDDPTKVWKLLKVFRLETSTFYTFKPNSRSKKVNYIVRLLNKNGKTSNYSDSIEFPLE